MGVSDDLSSPGDWKKTVRRNKLLGMWAAEKLGIKGSDAAAYADALAARLTPSAATCSVEFARTSMPRRHPIG